MNLSSKVTAKDYYTSALKIANTNLKDKRSHQIKAQTENY